MKQSKNIWTNILFLFCGIVITVLVIYVFRNELISLSSSGTSSNGVCYTACENKVTITENSISSSIEKIYDAVVLVENYRNGNLYSTGTGFVYKVDENYGYLLTNYHVVSGNTSINIVLSNEEEVTATYVGGDSYLDIAILSIPKDKVLKVAELGNSEDSKLGDTVFTIGTPIDTEYMGTVTRGILSGKDRLVTVKDSSNNRIVMKVLQTDAAINPGNSGGPLVNINGEVIGINSVKLVEDEIEGMGFAIAIDDVISHLEVLEKGQSIERPYLGITMINVTDQLSLIRNNFTINSSIKEGVVVAEILENSFVANVLEKGDIITEINGKTIANSAYLRYELYKYEIGEKVTISYIRNGETKTSTVTLNREI